MRKIKFRGRRLDNRGWVKGSGIKVSESGTVLIYDEVSLRWHEVDPKTVGQYTNFEDKSGVEIYEGDVVKDEYSKIGVVRYNKGRYEIEGLYRPVSEFDDDNALHLFYGSLDRKPEIEVVGNVHEIPKAEKGE